MTTTVHHNTRHRGHNNNPAMELSISDLKAPTCMGDSSSQTASTVDESFHHQSFDFLNRGMLVKPLADTSETSTGTGILKDPSIAELQSVFASQARVRTACNNAPSPCNSSSQLLSDSSRVSLGDRLQKRWNNHSSLQESFSTMDSSATSAARAGSPVLANDNQQKPDSSEDEEEEEELFQMPVISISSSKNNHNKQPMNDGSMDESLFDFESVCFEPEVATSPVVEDKTRRPSSSRRRASATKTSNNHKYSGLGNLASYGTAALGKKKALLADIAATAGKRNKTKRSTSMRKDSKRGTKSRSTSPTAALRRESSTVRRTKRSERPSTRRASRKTRDDSPPPLVDSPREQQQAVRRLRTSENHHHHKSESRNSLRRTKTDSFSSKRSSKDPEVRRVKSSDYTPRPSVSSSTSGKSHARTKPRRAKSGDDLPIPNLGGRRKAAHQGRIAPTFEQVAMDIDLDDITASQHSPDYYYLDDTTAGEDSKSNLRSHHDSVRSNLMEEMVQAVQAKDETKAKRGSVMQNLLSMLLEDIGEEAKPVNPRSKPPTKPRRTRSSTTGRREMNASQSSASASGTSSTNSSARASTSSRRRKSSKE